MYRISISLVLFLFISTTAYSNEPAVILHPMINSMGYQVNVDGMAATNKCIVEYQIAGSNDWKEGFPPDRVVVNNVDQFRGSLFLLNANTTYEVKVRITDANDNLVNDIPLVSGTTMTSPNVYPNANVKWVSPMGNGDYSSPEEAGNLKQLLINRDVICGTTVMIMDGVYTELEMVLHINEDCSSSSPIQFVAAPDASPVFDGGYYEDLSWTQDAEDPKLYSADLPSELAYTNMCILNGEFLYPYPTVYRLPEITCLGQELEPFNGYNLNELNFEKNGFVRDAHKIWIKTEEGIDPNNSDVILSQARKFLTVYGSHHNVHLLVKGLTFKNISKSKTETRATADKNNTGRVFDIRRASHLAIMDCHFEYNNLHIGFQEGGNFINIQNNYFKMENGKWAHAMVKKSRCDLAGIINECNYYNDIFNPCPTSAPPTAWSRNYETAAISINQGAGIQNKHIIVRDNLFEGCGSGIQSPNNSTKAGALMEEVDFYGNTLIDCGDAVEADGKWCNLRVWANEIIRSKNAFSNAPPDVGPRYFYRNTVHHIKSRKNFLPDPHFNPCKAVDWVYQAGTAIKTNSGADNAQPSNLYFINNTFHSTDTLGFAFTFWNSEWKKIKFKNNIFYDENKHFGYFNNLVNPDFQLDFERNNFFSANPSSPLLVAKEENGQFVCHDIDNADDIETDLRIISGSNDIYCTEYSQEDPLFVDADAGNFKLDPNSLMIDEGEFVSGFYDFVGDSPDLGSKEVGLISGLKKNVIDRQLLIYPNPAKSQVTIEIPNQLLNGTLTMYSSIGQLLYSELLTGKSEHFIPLEGISTGLHIVCLEDADGHKFFNKLMVE